VEFWIPSAQPLDIRQISLPNPHLRPISEVPLFEWARDEEVGIWCNLAEAYHANDISRIPEAPDLDSNRWAISGHSELGAALCWAASSTRDAERNRWRFQYGAWLAGRGETDAASQVLAQSSDDRACALLGRLWLYKHDAVSAATCFRAIKSEAIALHPQVVVERDR